MSQIETQLVEYKDETGKVFEAFVARDASQKAPRPIALIFPTYAGRSEFEEGKARKLAEMGYVGFAADVYGKETIGLPLEEYRTLMKGVLDDRPGILLPRLKLCLETAKKLPYVDSEKVAAFGYCFGGVCVLDIARNVTDPSEGLSGVISLHGILTKAPSDNSTGKIHSKILVLHGYADPHVPPQQVLDFANEMTDRGADWQLHAYGHVLHAFTNPKAHDTNVGVKYDADADRRSWEALRYFLKECF